MKAESIGLLALLVLGSPAAIVMAACSSSSSPSGASDAGTKEAGVTNCVPTTTKNNAQGVGGYCTPNGGECKDADGGATICTADFASMNVPAGAWFCTNLCSTDAGGDPCGANIPCTEVKAFNLAVCLPTSCMGFLQAFEGDGGGPG